MALRGVTQKDIAEVLDVTPNTVTNWVKGRTEPHLTIKQWRTLATLLGTSLEHLPDSFAPQPINPDENAQ